MTKDDLKHKIKEVFERNSDCLIDIQFDALMIPFITDLINLIDSEANMRSHIPYWCDHMFVKKYRDGRIKWSYKPWIVTHDIDSWKICPECEKKRPEGY